MKKSQFQQPGRYGIYPAGLLSEANLTSTAKLVYMALLDCLRGEDDSVYPQVKTLARMTACGRTAVLNGLSDLEAMGWIRRDRSPGARTLYELLIPGGETVPSGTESGPGLGQSGTDSGPLTAKTGTESGPDEQKSGTESVPVVRNPDRYGIQTGTENERGGPDSGCRHKEETTTLSNVIPPHPPQAGGECAAAAPTGEEDAAKQIIADADAAHMAVFGMPMKTTWRRNLEREIRWGRASLAAAFTVENIRAGIKLAQDHKPRRDFGYGWVVQAIEAIAAKTMAHAAAQAKAAEAPAMPAPDKSDVQQRSEAARAHWNTLSEIQRADTLQRAKGMWPGLRHAGAIESKAILLAWQQAATPAA